MAKLTQADELRSHLTRAGLSQRELARILAINPRTVRHWCTGALDCPPVVIKIAKYLADFRGPPRSPRPDTARK